MYLVLLSLLYLHFVFSGALPFDHGDTPGSDGGGLRASSWAEAVDENGICKLNVSGLPLDCNWCSCVVGLSPACTQKGCHHYKDTHKPCKPGNTWKEDCNKCICSDEGLARCTIRDCLSKKRLKRYFGFDAEYRKKSHCTPGTSWKVDCNSCTCTEIGVPECTFKACIKWERIIDKSNLTKEIKELLDEDGKCKSFMVMTEIGCNTCFCSDDGELYCSMRSCPKKEHREKRTTYAGKISSAGKCKPGDHWKLDECNHCVCTHTGYASCSLNECSSPTSRSKRDSKGKIPAGGKCKPGDKWKLDECNNCVCTHTGFASCTLNECSQSKGRPKRTPITDGKIPAGGKCKPGDKWKLDECNNCVCTHTGFASCTLNECSQSKGRPKRSPAKDGKIPQAGKCKPGDKWKLDECNSCVCTHTGFASCTLNECSQSNGRPKRSPAKDGKVPQAGKCKPGERWKLDECNSCVCTHTGFASCTLNECPKPESRPKRSSSITKDVPPGGKCKPGDRWKLDECNNCVCTHTGFASCTLNECSSSNKGRPKRSPAGEGKINPGGKCNKPGEKWDLDECNKCVCTHTGYASCTLNDCSSQKRKGKRSTDGSLISQFVDEDKKCKKAGNFKIACNTCYCHEEGKYALCTRKGCIENSNIVHRSTRDARNENGNSGLECKPGVSWKENCNSCFCSERGIAMCTDIPTCPSPPPPPAPGSKGATNSTEPPSTNYTLLATISESTTEQFISTELSQNQTETSDANTTTTASITEITTTSPVTL